MRISDLPRATHTPVETIHDCEREGLLPEPAERLSRQPALEGLEALHAAVLQDMRRRV